MKLHDVLGLKETGVVSIVGAGGKTTLMYQLAKELAACGKTVLTTTTTKIFMPTPQESSTVIVSESVEKIIGKSQRALAGMNHLTAACKPIDDPKNQDRTKLKGLTSRQVDTLYRAEVFDWILVEADGARGKPIKACESHEPVIPSVTSACVMVTGLDAMGLPLNDENVFRARRISEISEIPINKPITSESIDRLLRHEVSLIKTKREMPDTASLSIFLNKADNDFRKKAGYEMLCALEKDPPLNVDRVILGSLHRDTYRITHLKGD